RPLRLWRASLPLAILRDKDAGGREFSCQAITPSRDRRTAFGTLAVRAEWRLRPKRRETRRRASRKRLATDVALRQSGRSRSGPYASLDQPVGRRLRCGRLRR